MKPRLLSLAAAMLLVAPLAFAQGPACVAVVDTLYAIGAAGPVAMNGTLTLQLGYTVADGAFNVTQSAVRINVVAGAVSTCLAPGSYTVAYSMSDPRPLTSTSNYARFWTVPSTGGPYTVQQIETRTPGPAGNAPSNGIATAVVVITAAQINSPTNVLAPIIPAPGSAKIAVPVAEYYTYKPGTTAFTGYGDCGFQFGYSNGEQLQAFYNSDSVLTQLNPAFGSSSSINLDPQEGSFYPLNQGVLFSAICGRITASSTGVAGTGFQVGDTFAIVGQGATGVVDTTSGGAVQTFHLTAQGTNYSAGPDNNTTVPDSTNGGDGGLRAVGVNVGGSGYVTGDTVSVDGCAESVLTVTAPGGTVSAAAITNAGGSCPAATGTTTTAITGSGGGLTVNTTQLGSGLSINIDAIQGYSGGNGSLTVGLIYTVANP